MMKMSLMLSLLISFFLLFRNVYAFNITELLNKYPDFTTFNNYLTQTKLATEINSRQSITILVVDNANIASLSGKSPDALKNILSAHVVLDYYDEPKLQKMSNKSITLTTLLQTTGSAKGQQGFLNATRLDAERVSFGPAAPGSTLGSNLVKSVTTQPYNLSVLQVSSVIIPQGVDGGSSSPSSSPSSTPTSSPGAAGPTTSAKSPSSNTAPSTAPGTAPSKAPATAPSMTPTTTPATAPSVAHSQSPESSPAEAPVEEAAASPDSAGTPAPAPDAGAPISEVPSSDAPVGADGPAADAKAAESTRLEIGLAVVFTMMLSTIYLCI